MIYFSERYSKWFFSIAVVMFLHAMTIIYFRIIELGAIEIVSAAVLVYSLGYPYLYRIAQGCYPSGYISPVEEVKLITDSQYAHGPAVELMEFHNTGYNLAIIDLHASKETIVSLINKGVSYKEAIAGLAYSAMSLDHDTFYSKRQMYNAAFKEWQSALRFVIKQRYEDSKAEKEYTIGF